VYPDLKNKIAIVTGGYQGLGRAISLGLAAEGAQVAVAARSFQKCNELAAQIDPIGGRAMGCQVDVTDVASVTAMVDKVIDRWGQVDLLVNNAGSLGKRDWIVDYDPLEWDRIFALNLRGPFLCCQAVLKDMIARGQGKIVNVAAGVMDERVDYGVAAYYAAKAGLINFTRQLAAETKRYGIFANAVDPGGLDTKMSDEVIATEQTDEFAGTQTNKDPSRRLRRPESVVPMIMFLLSKASDMMTGRLLQASSQDDVQYLQL